MVTPFRTENIEPYEIALTPMKLEYKIDDVSEVVLVEEKRIPPSPLDVTRSALISLKVTV